MKYRVQNLAAARQLLESRRAGVEELMQLEAGRVLSAANEQTLRDALDAIQRVLDAVAPDAPEASQESARLKLSEAWSGAAWDASEGARVLATVISLMGGESEEPPQLAMLQRAYDALVAWLSAEVAEIAVPSADDLMMGVEAGSIQVELCGELVPLVEAAASADGTRAVKIIKPGWGSSGHYPPEVLQRDGPKVLTAGTRMFWDHPTTSEEAQRPERSLRDLAAVLVEDAKWDSAHESGPGLYSRAKVFAPYGESVQELAPYIGVSIRGIGKGSHGTADGREGRIIEELVAVDSVDFVTTPGAGGQVLELFEAARTGRPPQPQPQPVTPPKEGPMSEEFERQLREAREESARNREALVALRCERRVDELLREVSLPEPTLRRIAAELVSKPPIKDNQLDDDALKAAVEAAVKRESDYLAAAGVGRITGFGPASQPSDDPKEDDFAAAFAAMGLSESGAKIAARGRA